MSDNPGRDSIEKGAVQIGFRGNQRGNRVEFEGKKAFLTDLQVRFLEEVLKAHPEPAPRSEIISAVWGNLAQINENAFDKSIPRLNRKLSLLGLAIKNEPSIGYRIVRLEELPLDDVGWEIDELFSEPSGDETGNPNAIKLSSTSAIDFSDSAHYSCPFLTRSELDRAIGSVEDRLEANLQELWVSGNDNMYVAKSLSAHILRLLREKRRVRLMGVDPESPAAEMLHRVDPRYDDEHPFKPEVNFVTNAVSEWHKAFPSTFEYRLLPILPALGFFITDPYLETRTVKIEIYSAKPWEPVRSRPHIVITNRMGNWGDFFVKQYENYWALGKSPFS